MENMSLRNRRFLFVVMVFGVLSACQQDKPTDKEANLYVRFDQAEQKLKAEALFYKIGPDAKKESIAFSNSVTFNGAKMLAKNLPGGLVRYDCEKPGPLTEGISFRLKEDDGNLAEFPVAISAFKAFSLKKIDCPKPSCLELAFEGPPLAKNEKLILMVADGGKKAHSFEFAGLTPQNRVTLTGEQLATLSDGHMSAYLVRSLTDRLKRGSYQVECTVECYSQSQTFDWPQ